MAKKEGGFNGTNGEKLFCGGIGMPQKTRRSQRIIDVIYQDVYEILSEDPSPEDILLAKEEAGLLW